MSPKEFDVIDEKALHSHNAEYLQSLLDEYSCNPSQLPPAWRGAFQSLLKLLDGDNANGPLQHGPSLPQCSVFNPPQLDAATSRSRLEAQRFQQRVGKLVDAFRTHGHRAANLDPLKMATRDWSGLAPADFQLQPDDQDRRIAPVDDNVNRDQAETLGDVQERLVEVYCRDIGFEFMHLDDPAERAWLQERIENGAARETLPRELQLRILNRLIEAVVFEKFVRKKYVGAKTFSLEGAETLIPLLDLALEAAADQGIAEVVMGMAHRGRLNVLANIVGKRPVDIFREFEDQHPDWWRGRGDVKYHLGYSGDWEALDGSRLHISLCFNPSHLEFIGPVALGRLRAKQDRIGDGQRQRGMAILIHGDASFAGEGIVQEMLNLSTLDAYRTGGTLHVVVNNQLGFTTAPAEGRSTRYPCDIAAAFNIPVFHVNGENPQAVARAVELAMEFRAVFQRDVAIDMYCYRRWGHNEADEPSFTQPLMYEAIEHQPSIRDIYLDHLLELDQITRDEADELSTARKSELRSQFDEAREESARPEDPPHAGVWQPYCGGAEPEEAPDTEVPADRLQELLGQLASIPDGFHVHKKLQKSITRRREMADGQRPADWSAAEALALATLAVEGHRVRITGQDAARGTFSQRHALLYDAVDGHAVSIFQDLADDQAAVEVMNSPLSEAGVLGFEFGYSLDSPDALVAWEAQYGDFANAAQVVIDQFLASAEDKWRRLSGIVLLLPHGFEGQGPEHSSARVNRFLSLAAEENIQIVVPSTAAQYFHVLRRQVKRKWRKPLVVLTPKSLLRDSRVASPLAELSKGTFQRILVDAGDLESGAKFVLLCSGKVFYDLLQYREENERSDIAIIRLEQLYPLSDGALDKALQSFAENTTVRWVQEEPENMGAWYYWKARFGDRLFDRFPLSVVSRPPSASPATGSAAAHEAEQRDLVERAFALED